MCYNEFMRLCIFSGTFNPIHIAHLKMAEYVLKNFGFDKILFIPAFKPPHKNYNPKMCSHRYKMVELAIKDNPNFEISDIEYKREKKSYTFDTVTELYKQFKIDGKINLIIGTDAFEQIETWYKTEELKKIVDFIVFVRENSEVNLDYLKNGGYNFKFAPMEFLDVSSTELRERIKNGKSIKNLVTKEVEEYIQENGLYKD